MNEIADRTESIFASAVAMANTQERRVYVLRSCNGDMVLQGQIEALLQAHDTAGRLKSQPVLSSPETTLAFSQVELPGTVIAGRYKLLEEIGEGGMGTVWVAEQTEPVRRKVAVKLIKPGMDSKTVLARFEAERQALAVMDHPNIAKVLDGGLTDSGRPFFAMEYVKGIPITEYCDAMRLSIPERLKLFMQVCSAVQHAHQKGIIHRDLKPSNILVAPYDDHPVPKVIDFGLAKAMHQSLTERTLHTAHETVLGTPIYMSPEQAQLNNLDVDTRSDLYSLGVLLYELLTGSTPLEKQRLKQAAWDEVRRIIREEEPPRPSTRISSCQTLPSLAAGRQTEPIQLSKQVRGELDWIVMKALEKDRNRRYETANGFALDIQRYLDGEPVLAAPPSTTYRLKKFARKHRTILTTVTLLTLILTTGIAVSAWQAVRATRAESKARTSERQAKNDRVIALNQQLLAEEREKRAKENEEKARVAESAAKDSDATTTELLNFVRDKIFVAARPPMNKGGLGKDVTLRRALDEAETKITESFATRPRIEAQLRSMYFATYWILGETNIALTQIERAFALAKEHFGIDDEFTCSMERGVVNQYMLVGRSDEGIRLLEQSLERRKQTLGPEHPLTDQTFESLCLAYQKGNRTEDEQRLRIEVARIHLKQQDRSREDAYALLKRSVDLQRVGNFEESAQLVEGALPQLTEKLGPNDEKILRLAIHLSLGYIRRDRYQEAVAVLEPAYHRAGQSLGPTHGVTRMMLQNLAYLFVKVGRQEDGVALLEPAILGYRRDFGPANHELSGLLANLSFCYVDLQRFQQAVDLLEETIAAIPEKDRMAYRGYRDLLENLSGSYQGLGKLEEAFRVLKDLERHHRAHFPAGSLDLAAALAQVGTLFIELDHFADAERVLKEAYQIRKSKEPDSWRVSSAKMLLGVAIAGQGRYSEAEPLIADAVVVVKANRSEFHDVVVRTLEQSERTLATVYMKLGQTPKGLAICQEANALGDRLNKVYPEFLYQRACWRSVTSLVMKSTNAGAADQLALDEADSAMELLKRAIAAGYKDIVELKRGHHLDPLRDRDDFQQLIKDLSVKPKE